MVSYRVTEQPIFSRDQIAAAGKINLYDSIDEEVLRSFNEYALASLIYYGMKEGACSEQSSRMTAMEAASKNAGKCVFKDLHCTKSSIKPFNPCFLDVRVPCPSC